MSEKPREGKEVFESGLKRLEEEKKKAIAALDETRAEHQQIMDALIAKGTLPKTFNDSFEKLKQAERVAFDAVEAWAKIAVKEDR